MDKKVTKNDFIKEIRQHLATLGTAKGESLEVNATVSRQRLTMGEKVYNNEIRVKWVSSIHVFIEWYTNGERRDYSGAYPWKDVNVNYNVCMNLAAILWEKVRSNDNSRREFADHERVIVTGEWGHSGGKPVTQEVATVHAYDSETGKYWVIFRSGHGNGNSWHEADKLQHVPDWIKDGAQVYSVTGWREGQPFTISNAAAEVVTLTAPDGFKFCADIVEVLTQFTQANA